MQKGGSQCEVEVVGGEARLARGFSRVRFSGDVDRDGGGDVWGVFSPFGPSESCFWGFLCGYSKMTASDTEGVYQGSQPRQLPVGTGMCWRRV